MGNPPRWSVEMAFGPKMIECEPRCGFKAVSHDEKELLQIAIQHVKRAHDMTVTEKDVKGLLKPA